MTSKTLRCGVKAAAVVGAATTALGFLSAGAANADVFAALADGTVVQELLDGSTVTVTQTGNSALINPSIGGTPLHRNVWASGNIDVTIDGPAKGGTITTGYIVACQLTFSGEAGDVINNSLNVDIVKKTVTETHDGGLLINNDGISEQGPHEDEEVVEGIEVEAKLQVPGPKNETEILIGPGEANSVEINSFDFKGQSGGATYSDETFAIKGCAGYAQARSYVTVDVSTDTVDGTVTLWGQPFSLG
jgi:hypothetical protein